jgi:hypothetical protein
VEVWSLILLSKTMLKALVHKREQQAVSIK